MLIEVDAAALEWRCAVWLSQDTVGIAEIHDKQDVHSNNERTFELPSRLIAKKYLFRTIYRGSGYAFSIDTEFKHVSDDPAYWDNINEKFYTKYHGLDATHKRWAELVAQHKPIVGPFGRQWRCSPYRNYKGELAIPWTKLTNYPVQGTGHDIMSIARVKIKTALDKAGGRAIMVSTVHDSIIVDAPSREVEPVARIMYNAFDTLPDTVKDVWNVDMNIPFPGEVKIGPNWGNMTNLHQEDL